MQFSTRSSEELLHASIVNIKIKKLKWKGEMLKESTFNRGSCFINLGNIKPLINKRKAKAIIKQRHEY